jgi:hypothetical protein
MISLSPGQQWHRCAAGEMARRARCHAARDQGAHRPCLDRDDASVRPSVPIEPGPSSHYSTAQPCAGASKFRNRSRLRSLVPASFYSGTARSGRVRLLASSFLCLEMNGSRSTLRNKGAPIDGDPQQPQAVKPSRTARQKLTNRYLGLVLTTLRLQRLASFISLRP